MKDSAKYVGTPQSIAIRIPDCSVTTHLIDLVSGQSTLVPAAPVAGPGHSAAHGAAWVSVSRPRSSGLLDGSERLELSVSPPDVLPLLPFFLFSVK